VEVDGGVLADVVTARNPRHPRAPPAVMLSTARRPLARFITGTLPHPERNEYPPPSVIPAGISPPGRGSCTHSRVVGGAGGALTRIFSQLHARDRARAGSAGFQACCVADFQVGGLSGGSDAWRVWKPAIQQTWKSALRTACEISRLVLARRIPPGRSCRLPRPQGAPAGPQWPTGHGGYPTS